MKTRRLDPEVQLACLSLALDRLGEMVIVTDLEHIITYATPVVEDVLGYRPDELIGRPSGDVFDNIPGNPPDLTRWIADQNQQEDIWRGEVFSRRKDGSIIKVHLTLSWLRDRTGKIIGCIGISLDITAREKLEKSIREARDRLEQRVKERTADLAEANVQLRHEMETRLRVEASLRESEDKFRTIFERARDPICIETLAGAIVEVNRAVCSLLGYSREELLTMRVADIVPPDVVVDLGSLVRFGTPRPGDYIRTEGLRKDGTRVPVEISAAIVTIRGEERLIAVVRDISERIRAEEELRQANKIESMARLAGGMAHDFGNLLNAIRGYVEILRSHFSRDDPLQIEILELDNAVARAAALIRKLLTFGRRQTVTRGKIDVNSVLGDLVNMLRRVCGRRIELSFDPAPRLHPIIGDRGQLEQIIINLIINAREAIPGPGAISVSTANIEVDQMKGDHPGDLRSGSSVLLSVRDTGCGMDDETRSRLFEPFFSTKRERDNSGLGLSIVYGLVKQAGGAIRVDSSPGRGSLFAVYLPAAPAVLPESPPADDRVSGSLSIFGESGLENPSHGS